MIIVSSPLPTRSSMYFHRNCMSRTKSEMRKVTSIGPAKARSTRRVSFFNALIFSQKEVRDCTSYFLLLTSYFLLLTSYFLLLTSYFLLLTSYFLLLTSYFILL